MALLEVKSLTVSVVGRRLLDDVSLEVSAGEAVALFGPNGSGKSTLLNAIMGIPAYQIESGSILFKGTDITRTPMDERARMGLGMGFQRPPALRGVKLGELLRRVMMKRGAYEEGRELQIASETGLDDFMMRQTNLGFSGGEAKRSELAQLIAQWPVFTMFDEPDSGVDIVSVRMVGGVIARLLEKDRPAAMRTRAGIIVTHAGHILEHVNADRAFVLMRGRLLCAGNPLDLLEDIRARGYEECLRCSSRKS